MKITVTLPSLYPDSLERTIANLESATQAAELEVIVVTPFPVEPRQLRCGYTSYIQDTTNSGENWAHNAASKLATGDFIQAWTDDHLLDDGWDVTAIDDFLDREGQTATPYLLGLRQHSDNSHVGTAFGNYYPYFPLMRVPAMEQIGGWLDPIYGRGWGDLDIACRVWEAGGRCEWSEKTLVTCTPDDDAHRRQFSRGDTGVEMNTFIARWKDRIGQGSDTSHIRAFNVDRCIVGLPPHVRSFRNNAPC